MIIDPTEFRDTLKEEGIQIRMVRLPGRGRYPDRDRRPSRRGGYPGAGSPNGGGPPNGGEPPNGGGPPDGNGGPLDPPVDKDHQVLKDLLDQ